MGILDKLFGRNKEENEEQIETINTVSKNRDRTRLYLTTNGRKVYEYYDGNADFGQFYDTTRLIVDKAPIEIKGKELYDIMVSWYGENDAVYLDEDGPKGRRDTYEHVIAGLDPNLLDNDPKYLKYAVKALLNKERVERYLKTGLMTEQEIAEERARTGNKRIYPCGKYVGEVVKKEDKYSKAFDVDLGRMLHNSLEMIDARREYKKSKEMSKQLKIEKLKEKQAIIQKQIDELNGDYEDER